MDVLAETTARSPKAAAVVGVPASADGEAPVWSYEALDRWVDVVAGALVRGGVGQGDRVGMRLPPCPEAVVLFHAVLRAGAVLVPLNATWTDAEFARGLAAVGPPSLLFTTEGEVVPWNGESPEWLHRSVVDLPGPRSGDPAVLVLTSGSTGQPSAIHLTHRNLTASAEAVRMRLGLTSDDCWLTSLSPGHVGGIALIHRAARIGSSTLTRPRFDASETAELIDSGRVTHASLVPVMLARLLDARENSRAPSSLRCLLLGGAPMPPALLERALGLGYPIAMTYGLTEASSQVATAPPEQVSKKPGTVGRPLSGVELRIVRPNPEGVGEIVVRGPTVVGGLPRHATRRSEDAPSVYLDRERWLHTGDLGRLDADGDLWVVGRISDRIVTGGVTVEPGEVEEVLSRHPGVREVAVVGAPDAEWGERVVAVVVPKVPSSPPSLADLQEFVRERLASSKRPRELRVVDTLPRNPSGKVDRGRLSPHGTSTNV